MKGRHRAEVIETVTWIVSSMVLGLFATFVALVWGVMG